MGISSWWNKVRGRPAAPAVGDVIDVDAPARLVATHELSDQLRIHEYHHATRAGDGPIAVRTFVTEGLAALDAREVRVTVPADWDEAATTVAAKTLATLHRLAGEGQPAQLGGWTVFEAPGLAGGKRVGLTYARGAPIPGIAGAEAALVAVLLHAEEAELVQRGLATRVLGLLAMRARIFPYPAYWEVRTAPVLRVADQEQSLLEQVKRVILGDVRVTVEEGDRFTTVVVSVPEGAAAAARTMWSDASLRSIALMASLSPDADGQATWVPGSTERTANSLGSAPPRRLGFAFLMVAGTDETPAELRYIEDGVGLILGEATVDQLREALIAGSQLTLPVGDGSRLVLEVRRAPW